MFKDRLINTDVYESLTPRDIQPKKKNLGRSPVLPTDIPSVSQSLSILNKSPLQCFHSQPFMNAIYKSAVTLVTHPVQTSSP